METKKLFKKYAKKILTKCRGRVKLRVVALEKKKVLTKEA